jgi:hypothetical protein
MNVFSFFLHTPYTTYRRVRLLACRPRHSIPSGGVSEHTPNPTHSFCERIPASPGLQRKETHMRKQGTRVLVAGRAVKKSDLRQFQTKVLPKLPSAKRQPGRGQVKAGSPASADVARAVR